MTETRDERSKTSLIYEDYRKAVVDQLVTEMGEDWRHVWETASFDMEFEDGLTVDDCITAQIEAMEGDWPYLRQRCRRR
jgi:hypothetical protein